MEIKLLKNNNKKGLILLIAFLTIGLVEAQNITNLSWEASEPNVFNFDLVNGNGGPSTHFNYSSNYRVFRLQVSTTPNFEVNTFATIEIITYAAEDMPVGNGSSLSYQINFSIPNNHPLNFHTYPTIYMRIIQGYQGIFPTAIPVQVIRDIEYEGNEPGFILCQTPAFSYRYITITNTGNAVDNYNISFVNEHPGQFATTALNFNFEEITTTPNIQPGNEYTFIVKVYLTHGTAPGDENNTTVFLESNTDNTFIEEIVFLTTAYCGNGNGGNNPDMPDAPDLAVDLDLINELDENVPVADVGGNYRYRVRMTSLLQNKGVRNPVLVVTFPENVEYGQLSYSVGPNIDVSKLDFTLANNQLEVTYITGNSQNNYFKLEDLPIVFYREVFVYCDSGSEMEAEAFVVSSQGDSNTGNDYKLLDTDIVVNPNQADVGLWLGVESNDWFNCLNWNKGVVPNSFVNVTIPNTAPNQPRIDFNSPFRQIGEVAQTGSITFNSGSSLTMVNNSELHVSGDWTNNGGTLIPGNGTVAFVGDESDQIIFDLSEEPTFYNLMINTPNKVFVTDGHGLFVNNQLDLEEGVLRLQGLAQFIQPSGASVTANTGKLWRDQRGHANMYNYNYWSSPVGNTSGTYTINAVKKDGTDNTTPQNIQWTGNLNVNFTLPITVSTRWTYKFQSTSPQYANWQKINQNTTLNPGQGYTMKGSGNPDPSGLQNYIFVGVPFTGNISHNISNGQITLLGNPYASALDAVQFINDNQNTIDGTLEFWDHFQTTNSHNLDQYMGGYAKYNLTDQIAAVNLNGAQSTKVPTRYLPVGQGFFVTAKEGIEPNSQIVFNNSQRAFVKEDDPDGMQMYGIPESNNTSNGTADGPAKIKLNMISAENFKHQIAIGFMQNKATEAIDYGYDALLKETDPNQFYFSHPDANLVIQGVGYFDESKVYPLGVNAKEQGRYTFSIEHLENIDEKTEIYFYDNEKQIYHDLRKSDYYVKLTKGEYNTRFSLRFKNHSLDNNLNVKAMLENIIVYRQNNQVIIANQSELLTVLNAQLYNVLGQEVTAWNISNGREPYIELPLSSMSSGIYIVQVQTDQGAISKKINVK